MNNRMRKKNLTLLLTLGLLFVMPCIARQTDPVAEASPQPENLSQQRQQYQREIGMQLRRLRRDISALRDKAPQKGEEIRNKFYPQMAELERKRLIAEKKFAKLQDSGQRAWQNLKPGVDAAVRDLD